MTDDSNFDDAPNPEEGRGAGAPLPPSSGGDIAVISIEDELKRSYLDYAMSVIVSRALPDARDGLKPVHRRILYSMHDLNMTPERSYSKCARVVGDVLGRFHPHGDASVYMALVRMAQPFSMGLMLIDGQGNFGSVDGDMPASMRYTEARMAPAASALLTDIDKDTVDFQPNYDEKELEPVVLPARIPNLLVNGAGGIAVGMATNIPPHNLGEIVDACIALLDDPEVSDDALLDIVPGPDFPTGGEILGRTAPRNALRDGRGSVVVRGVASVETIRKDREAIVVTELPFQVNKQTLIERIAEMVREKRLEGISDVRDESDRAGMRIVIELKRDASGDVILNQLWRYTAMQSSFGVNMLALNHGRPEQMGLRKLLEVFLDFREEVVVRRVKFELAKARDRGHVLVGLAVAVANIDEVIHIIRSSADPAEARERLQAKAWPVGDMIALVELIADPRSVLIDGNSLKLTDEQARAILGLTLSRLTGLGRDDIFGEARGLADTIQGHLTILSDRKNILAIIREDLLDVRNQFAVPRRTLIGEGDFELEDEDLIPREDMVVTVTHGGYVKRVALNAYRTQHRGGKGKSGMTMKDEDAITGVFSASTHTPVLFFATNGKAYKLKVWRLPLGAPTSRGKAFVNLLPIEPGDSIMNVLPLPEDETTWGDYDIMFATRSGDVRRNKLSDFATVNRAGKIAMKLEDGDHMVGVALCTAEDDVLLTTAGGRAIRFKADDVRVFKGRDSTGVRGVRLQGDDAVISMAVLGRVDATPDERAAYVKHANAMRKATGESDDETTGVEADDEGAEEGGDAPISPERIAALGAAEQFILTVTETGFGKRSSAYEYRRTGRGGQGLTAHGLGGRAGKRLAAAFPVEESDDLLLVTSSGQMIRTRVGQVRIVGRSSQGVTIFRTAEGERVVSVERLAETGGGDEPEVEGDGED
ncbi:DNA gyrase subunit A [Brevundimonas subvibrioides]|uniref:DNA gyrase subunit A n=1 Tax=Brevundimonas subvibrioides (strain ATCC 15264 / DSM 4735 / LMG 14903 / NBRC 16000 / CB 81) TaxID=633149 RepID=D9QLP1_BRESC|nr:DNA gyrase, A subunit [Brevundimonas subvibrioides ATCC 15264]